MNHPAPISPAQLLTVKQAAAWLKVSERTVYRLIESGDLSRIKIGRLNRIPVIDIYHLVENQSLNVDNQCGTGSHDNGELSCRAYKRKTATASVVAKTVRSTGRLSPTQAVKELDALLEQRT